MDLDVLSNLIIKKVHSVTTIHTAEGKKRREKAARPGWALVYKYEGETVYKCGGKEYVSDANSIMILPKGCEYEWQCTRAGHFIITEFECDNEYNKVFCLPIKNGEKYLQQLQRLEYNLALKSPTVKIEALRDIYSIIIHLIQRQHGYMPSDKLEKISPALEYIAKNYNAPTRNEYLAELTGLSCVYFRKLFTEVMGVSPIAYVHSLRIKKACEMLRSDYSSIADIAQSLGYSNVYDFSRDFKKHTGKSPSKY